MRIATVITDQSNFGFQHLLKPSIITNSLHLDVLDAENYQNHRKKDVLLLDYLSKVDQDEIIFFTDGYDTMFLAGEKEILDKYYKTGKEILFAAEMICWPDAELQTLYPKNDSLFKYLNSGGFIGRAGYIKNRISENLQTRSILKYPWSNQIYWTEQFLSHSNEIGVDTSCEIFCTMVSDEDAEISKEFLNKVTELHKDKSFEDFKAITDFHIENESINGDFNSALYYLMKRKWFDENFTIRNSRIFFNESKNSPCHIHFNGGSDVLIEDLMAELSSNVVSC